MKIDWDNMPEWADVWIEPKHEDEIGRGWHLDDGHRWKKQEGYYWLKKDVGRSFDVYYPPEKQWRGPEDGFPPVGTICEKAPHWHKCEIIAEHDGGIVIYDMHNLNYYKVGKGMIFRTIPSPRDEWVEKVSEITEGLLGPDGAAKIYDALLSGELPIPGVE